MQEFNSTNDMLEGFMVSVYVLGVKSLFRSSSSARLISYQFAFGPLSTSFSFNSRKLERLMLNSNRAFV
jgi:hypothetical protein